MPVLNDVTEKGDVFRVYDKKSDKITELPAKEYIFGVVAAEMPALYETEALKAQAVAAYTYALYKKNQNKDKKYDITTDFSVDQSYKSRKEALDGWGTNGKKYEEKIDKAVAETLGEYMSFEGKPILAVYHAVSSGQTRSAKSVWGKEIPYLQSVLSSGDKLASNYIAKKVFTKTELKENFKDDSKEFKSDTFKITESQDGWVNTINVFGNQMSGELVRNTLELPSSNFKITIDDEKYTFTTYGWGHGVGMSQAGADYMAKQGYTYVNILNHYYNGSKLER